MKMEFYLPPMKGKRCNMQITDIDITKIQITNIEITIACKLLIWQLLSSKLATCIWYSKVIPQFSRPDNLDY